MSSEATTCALCRRQFAKYTCPTSFVKILQSQKELEDDIRGQPSKTAQERQQMMELLKRFEEESAEQDDQDAEDEADLEFMSRFQDLDLDATSADQLWTLLTPEERERFLKAMEDPSSGLATQLLASKELEREKHDPWWTDDAWSSSSRAPEPLQLPDSLKKPNLKATPLIYNICCVLVAYSYITRHISVSTLSGASDSDSETARDLFAQLTPFLTSRTSKTVLSSLDSVITDLHSRLPPDSTSPRLFALLLRDAATILRPALIVEVEADGTETPQNALRALGDIHSLFTSQAHVAHKITFYAASLTKFVARLAALELDTAAKVREVEVISETSLVGENTSRLI
uniref:HIT-type domain-containing protein n=1 Tax=Mycena chlorophos TaxID=658473 RepID=A0ABQ0LT17_MYCCL|nr:predicted protein [Mycena chlorophos]